MKALTIYNTFKQSKAWFQHVYFYQKGCDEKQMYLYSSLINMNEITFSYKILCHFKDCKKTKPSSSQDIINQ